jgi:uncharacterized alkaline shock family protein YloU
MDIVNRIVMIVVGLIVFLFGAITFLLLTGLVVPQNTYLRSILTAYTALRALVLLRGAPGNVAILIALALAIIGAAVLVFEFWAPVRYLFRRGDTGKQYLIRKDALGQVTVSRSMVNTVVQHEAEAVPGVVQATPAVKDGKDGLHVSTRASLLWDADAPGIGQALQERIKDSVQTHLGLPVAEVHVTAQSMPQQPKPKEPPRRRVA